MTSSSDICDLSCKDLLNILREFRFIEKSQNEFYITLKSDSLLSIYPNLIITLPNIKTIPGPIIESVLKQGRISKKDYIERLKEILPIHSKISMVVHVDILGFKSLIKEVKDDNHKYNEILNNYNRALKKAFHEVQSTAEHNRSYEWDWISHVRVYTDNLLFINQLDSHGQGESTFGHTLSEVALYQLNLALEGFFTRGVVFVESSYCDEILVFTPVLLKAEEYEKKADYPRVILDESAITQLKKYFECYTHPDFCQFNKMLLVDQDGQFFINYLFILHLFSEYMVQWQRDGEDEFHNSKDLYYPEKLLHQHRNIIQKNLKKFGGKSEIYRKYHWLAKYHNYCCKEYFPKDLSALIEGIEDSFLSPWSFLRE